MRTAASILVGLGIAVVAVAPSQASYHKAKAGHHLVKKETPAPVRVCDWVGPGGRAIYRCTTVQPERESFLEPQISPVQRACDWIGPGGRAIYVCR